MYIYENNRAWEAVRRMLSQCEAKFTIFRPDQVSKRQVRADVSPAEACETWSPSNTPGFFCPPPPHPPLHFSRVMDMRDRWMTGSCCLVCGVARESFPGRWTGRRKCIHNGCFPPSIPWIELSAARSWRCLLFTQKTVMKLMGIFSAHILL